MTTNLTDKKIGNDTEVKSNIDSLEKLVLGEKGLGILKTLGITPANIHCFIDQEYEYYLKRIVKENKQYIIKVRALRAL